MIGNANFWILQVTDVEVKMSYDVASQLIMKWGDWNFYRIFMPLAGAALGLWNLLSY
jgi:hypothetical protein